MEDYGYNIVIDMDKDVSIKEIDKISKLLGVECNSYEYGDYYCYDKKTTDNFLDKIIGDKLAETIYLYVGKESEDYDWKLLATININKC